jgi:hypothetical protein
MLAKALSIFGRGSKLFPDLLSPFIALMYNAGNRYVPTKSF